MDEDWQLKPASQVNCLGSGEANTMYHESELSHLIGWEAAINLFGNIRILFIAIHFPHQVRSNQDLDRCAAKLASVHDFRHLTLRYVCVHA